MKKRVLMTAALVAVAFSLNAQTVSVNPAIKPYAKTSGVSGSISAVGSDTLVNLMSYWSEAFRKQYPGVMFNVEGKGSSTAPPALIEGTSQLGPMSRTMKSSEIDAFVKKYGYKPTEISIAIDTLAVYVNRNCPLKSLTLQQVDAIFSKTRNAKNPEDIVTWGQLGLKGEWANKPISLYGRNSASGTYGFFKDHALLKGDYKDTVKEQPGSASVVQGVEKDKFSIGYSGFGYKTSGVKALALSNGGKAVDANYANALNGTYPLGRTLYIYINKAPGKAVDPKVAEFIKFALSKEGQELVIKDGYFPLTPALVKKQLEKLK